jgi:hypothetical protein
MTAEIDQEQPGGTPHLGGTGVYAHVENYYLERTKANGPWTRVRVIRPRDGLSYAEIFEVGEPIHLANGPNIKHDQPHDAIWWIEGFEEWRGRAIVIVNTRGLNVSRRGEFPASELQKLPAMLRIAVEARG